jgi:hypothetical protein
MTKSLELSDEAAYEFERVRRTIWISTGEYPDNNAVVDRLCKTFFERIAGGP